MFRKYQTVFSIVLICGFPSMCVALFYLNCVGEGVDLPEFLLDALGVPHKLHVCVPPH